jgi:flagellar biosynthesis protein FliR
LQQLLDQLGPFLLATFRIAGVFLVAPLLASTSIPVLARTLLVFALGLAVYPMLPAWQCKPVAMDLVALAWGAAGETLLGFSIGLLMLLPMTAVQLAGHFMGQQMGFGLATVYNPALEADTDLLGDLLGYIAIGLFLTIGGMEALFLAVCRTFERVPLGGMELTGAPLDLLTGLLASGFELATRVSMPLTAIILIETVASAFITKTLPQANILSIGFAVKIVLGFLALIAGLTAMQWAIGDDVGMTVRQVLNWAAGG